MEQNSNQERRKKTLFEKFPFLLCLKSRLITYVDKETGKRYTGHVAMYYWDTGKIRIDWSTGWTDYYLIGDDAVWLFKTPHKKESEDETTK